MNSYIAEFVGTTLLILLGVGVNASVTLKESKSAQAGWLVVCLGWGIAVTLSIYAVGSISGAHLNPAVTLALALKGSFPWEDVPFYMIAQLSGAICGSALVYLQFLPHWERTSDQSSKLGVFATAPAIKHNLSNFISELLGTSVLIFALLFIGTNQFATGLNPLIVGTLITGIGLSLGGTTGFAINPARDLGPRIAHALLPIPGKGSSDWGYAWIPVLGPLSGAIIAVWIFNMLY
jgi:glycerol uptake facilitator protein